MNKSSDEDSFESPAIRNIITGAVENWSKSVCDLILLALGG